MNINEYIQHCYRQKFNKFRDYSHMPLPKLAEWCSTSFSSIHRSVHQLINSNMKTDEALSSWICAIQTLRGKTPGEKYKKLSEIVRVIVECSKERGEVAAESEYQLVPAEITALVRTIVAGHTRSREHVIEGLRSNDVSVSRRAFAADWFFEGSTVNVDQFIREIMPFVSVRTRLDIIKKLSRSLQGHPKKAEAVFTAFIELYGVERCLPLLIGCSQKFIYEVILKYRIVLPLRLLEALHFRYPSLVVRYLQLGNAGNVENVEDRKVHEIEIQEYDAFLPRLIAKHPKVFAELHEIMPEGELKIGSKRAKMFLANSKQKLIEMPRVYLRLLPLKLVSTSRRFSKEDFDTMYENLFPKDIGDFDLEEMLNYIEYYRHGDKAQLLMNTYYKVYGKNLLEDETRANTVRLLKMLSANERQMQARFLLNKSQKEPYMSDKYTSYLPPAESLPIFKEKIAKSSSADERIQLFGHMILSCSLYDSKKDLLDVLRYYNEKHKNEQNFVFRRFLEYLQEGFDLESLGQNHWIVLREIIHYAYVKKELFVSNISLIESVLKAALHYLVVNEKNNIGLLDKMVDLIVKCKMEQSSSTWNVEQEHPELEKQCIEHFFQVIPLKYPGAHPVWKKKNDRLARTLSIIKTIDDYNTRNFGRRSGKKQRKKKRKLPTTPGGSNFDDDDDKIKIEAYPWIVKLTDEFFRTAGNEPGYRQKLLLKLIKLNAPDLYEFKLSESCAIRDIESGEALSLLKRCPEKVLANWQEYLAEAREGLCSGSKEAYRFVLATKWYQEIPVRFIERCLQDVRHGGGSAILVLGILMEGEELERVIAELELDKPGQEASSRFELTCASIRAMRYANPPASLEGVIKFCRSEYASLAEGTLMSVAHRHTVDEVKRLVRRLVEGSVTSQKRAIRLLWTVATITKLRKFLEKRWAKTSSPSVRHVLACMIFKSFVEMPNSASWDLMKQCIAGLTEHDSDLLERLSDVQKLKTKFLSNYVEVYLDKIEQLSEKGVVFKRRTECICLLLDCLDAKMMVYISEEMSLVILRRYFLDTDSMEISRTAQRFAVTSYLLAADTEQFEERLNSIMDILTTIMEQFDEPHPRKPRFYAANHTIRKFFLDVLHEISRSQCQRSNEIVERMLRAFTAVLMPWQEPLSYIALNLYKEHLEANSPKDFGIRCARRVAELVEDFSANETIIANVAESLNDFIVNMIYRHLRNPGLKLSVIEGLLEGDDFYGSLVGIKLLDYLEVDDYDDRYDVIVKTLRQKQNASIQYHLCEHLNKIKIS